jgi:predicted transposase/invertase (TIGR01784 family)
MYDKWLFVLHNLSRLMKRPEALQERIFTRLFEQAEIAKYTPEERQDYEDSLKVYRDMKNVLDTAELKGLKKGLKQGIQQGIRQGIEQGAVDERRKNAKIMKAMGLPLETIEKVTGMSAEDIAKL